MKTDERKNLVAPCGIDCGICELYVCRDNPQLLAYLVARGIPKEKLPCAGCRDVRGHCPVIGSSCATYECVTEKQVDFCFKCEDFPCAHLAPTADRADILPHNMKVFNLCTIQKKGMDAFIEQSAEFKQKYYQGKMAIGKGPQIEK